MLSWLTKIVRPYVLLVCVLTLGTGVSYAEDLSFSATLVKDSMVMYESIWVLFVVRNNGSETIASRPIILASSSVSPEVWNLDTGDKLPRCVHSVSYVSSEMTDGIAVPPSGILEGAADLLWEASCRVDSAYRVTYWPPGHYRVVFEWREGKRRFDVEPGAAVDTVEFWVTEPEGEFLEAKRAFLMARRRRLEFGPEAGARALWDVVNTYSSTPYAAQALLFLENSAASQVTLPPGVDMREILSKLVLLAPDGLWSRRVIRRLGELMPDEDYAKFLVHVRDTQMGTFAAKCASTAIAKRTE